MLWYFSLQGGCLHLSLCICDRFDYQYMTQVTLSQFLNPGFKRLASSLSCLLEHPLLEPWGTTELWHTEGCRLHQQEEQVEMLYGKKILLAVQLLQPPGYLSYFSWEPKSHGEKASHPGHTLSDYSTHRIINYNYKNCCNPICFGVVCCTAIDDQNKERTHYTWSLSSWNLRLSN